MLIVLAVIILIVLFAVAGLGWYRWTWRLLVNRRVVVRLDTGLTIAGVILSRRGPLLELGDVTVHVSAEQQSRADGTAVIERHRVVWIQVV